MVSLFNLVLYTIIMSAKINYNYLSTTIKFKNKLSKNTFKLINNDKYTHNTL
jgi:hypothetical protein